jgi:hypothetical protein
VIRALFYTPREQRDWLGHAIVRVEDGTWSHVVAECDGVVVEAIWPRVHLLEGETARLAMQGARRAEPLHVHDDWAERRAWARALGWVGRPYSLAEIVGDALASTLAIRNAVPQLPGSVVCSHLLADVAQIAGDERVPIDRLPAGITPADLGGMLLGRRLPPRSGSH